MKSGGLVGSSEKWLGKDFPLVLIGPVGNGAAGCKDIGFSSVLFRTGKYDSFLTELIIKQSPSQSFGNQNACDFFSTGCAMFYLFSRPLPAPYSEGMKQPPPPALFPF